MKYKNSEPPEGPQSFSAVWKWQVTDRVWGRRREAPGRFLTPRAEPDLALLASNEPSLTWVGHASFILRLDGLTFFIDPVWSERLSGLLRRNTPPGIALEQAPRPDVVLVTHNHRDHLDAATIARIDRLFADRTLTDGPPPIYVVPEGLGSFFRGHRAERVVELPWWGEHAIERDGRRATITFVPSQHWSQRGPFDRNETLWGGYVIGGGGRRAYHSGDTAAFGGFREIGRRYPAIDVAMLPIGAYEPEWFMRRQHMNPEDALDAFDALGARLLCAMHWGTFKLTDEPLDEPPRLLEELRAKRGLAKERVYVPAVGQSRRL